MLHVIDLEQQRPQPTSSEEMDMMICAQPPVSDPKEPLQPVFNEEMDVEEMDVVISDYKELTLSTEEHCGLKERSIDEPFVEPLQHAFDEEMDAVIFNYEEPMLSTEKHPCLEECSMDESFV
jgi:hypothetical protein